MARQPLVRLTRDFYRAMPLHVLLNPKHAPPDPLYYYGSLQGRRFTPISGPAGLYLSEDPATTPAELRMVQFDNRGRLLSVATKEPQTIVSIRGRVSNTLDLTDKAVRRALDVRQADLRADWEKEQDDALRKGTRLPITQILALAAHATGRVNAIRYPSAQTKFGVNLVAFPDRLITTAGDFVEVVDGTGLLARRIP